MTGWESRSDEDQADLEKHSRPSSSAATESPWNLQLFELKLAEDGYFFYALSFPDWNEHTQSLNYKTNKQKKTLQRG